jgi:hypothetical protein
MAIIPSTTAADSLLVATVAAKLNELFAGSNSMRKQYGAQCRNCYRPPATEGAEWCDSPDCQKTKLDLEQGRIVDTGKRGPHNATGALEYTTAVIGRPDLSYDNTVWAFTIPGKKESLPDTARDGEPKAA